jgi:N-acetylneuraminic acid mutarotase
LIIGNDMVIFSGFVNYFANATNQTYARDVTDSSSMWRRMDDMPMASGVTHAATVAIGTKVYLCGGYIGGHPGPHVPYCFVYDHSVSPGRQKQWTRFANLPNGGSAGGGMIYDSALNALFFSGGGQRREVGNPHPVDINNTWKFQLKNPSLGWVASTPIPYVANHLSYVTHMDGRGVERHFFLGGQVGEYECCTNFALNYEFIARTETWIRRASMPIPRGHATSSTRAIGCGFITAGGAINSANTTKVRTDDISYYDVPTDTWTVGIGTLPRATVTPIVDIHSNGYMYFVTGLPNQSRRQISVA